MCLDLLERPELHHVLWTLLSYYNATDQEDDLANAHFQRGLEAVERAEQLNRNPSHNLGLRNMLEKADRSDLMFSEYFNLQELVQYSALESRSSYGTID